VYTKDLSGNVTLYGQERCNWCGAASAQMTRNGYPNPADRLFYTQLDLWNTVQVYNSSDATDVGQGWATDPHGLTGCLQNLANPAGVHWVEFSHTTRDSVLFDILYWMNVREFPSPVLINEGGHWVVIVGWTTDVEPVGGSSPILQSIHIYDPEPHNVGSDTSFTAAQWYAGPWNGAVIYAGTWLNKYVAVVEPPIPKGRVRVREVRRTGTKLLTPAQALESARRAIEEQRLGDNPKYALLRREDAVSSAPLLVREETAGSKARNVPHYYIVGFGLRGETADRGERLVRVAVLVNAYTGATEEVTTFGRPIRYLTEEEARAIVARAMHQEPERLRNAEAGLMFQHGDITHIRSYPFWRVRVGKKNFYVDQLGQLYTKLLPSIPGD
jgi:hypothetical protein